MDQNQLNTFLSVARHLNFSEAAKELYISQPTVSHQISSLEKELDTTLFNRNARGISLTKSGELFVEDAKEMLGIREDALERLRLAKEKPELCLNIAYLLAPCQTFLPDMIADFREQYPQVELMIHRMNAREMLQALSSERYDLLFSIGHDLELYPQYAHKTIFNDVMCLVLPDSHPCAVSGKIDFSQLSDRPFLTLNPDVGPYLAMQALHLCQANNYNPSTIRQYDSMEEILFEVETGFGITILPSRNRESYPFSVTYLPLDGIYSSISIGVAWKQSSENPVVSWFLESLTTPPQKIYLKASYELGKLFGKVFHLPVRRNTFLKTKPSS